MKLHNTRASRTVRAAAQVCVTVALAGCGAAVLVLTPAKDHAGSPPQPKAAASAPDIPPGQRLEKFTLCYEMRHPRASPLEEPAKRFSIEVSVLVPQDDCLALDANGWLRGVPGQCSRAPAPSDCGSGDGQPPAWTLDLSEQ
jgi:hypothetical protein